MNIGDYIRQKRKQYRLSQVELAERASVGVRFIKDMEAGKQTLQLNKVNQVLNLFGEELAPKKISD
ncbi:MAG: helix-turn-helix domain-containing protein [Bacteroidales bacterium]|nr:helix-turn-helix domain-containing protein [Bacteroidales bacterium]